jgi:cell division septation protein DedD
LKDLKIQALSSLNQRIKRRYHLTRFSFEDTKNYIFFRLLKSGATGIPAFPEETLQKIFDYSGGIPRLINNICDTCLLIGASKELSTIPPNVVDEARHLVEGSLMGIEADTMPDSKEAAETVFSISEDISAANQEPLFSMLTDDSKDVQPPPPRPHPASAFGKKLRNAAIITVAAILLMLSGAILSWRFLNDAHIPTFSSLSGSRAEQTNLANPLTQQQPEAIKEQTVPQNLPAQPEKIIAKVPTLREELIDEPSVGIPVATARTEAMTSEPVNAQPYSKTEAVSPSPVEPVAFHPFSLRSSSYQQSDRALAEISEIRQLGLSPYLVKVDLGDMGVWWRIYIGLYSTGEEARSILKAYKLPNATVQKTDYACQVGEFSNETDTLNMFGKLKQSGYFPYAIQKGRDRFRLYLGAYEKKAEAETLNQELQKKGINSQVVKR